MITKHKLPDKLSDLILVALADLEQAENDPRYKVDMNTFHEPNGVCRVCFAGAVMAFGLGASPDARTMPYDFDIGTKEKLNNLDDIRCGYIPAGTVEDDYVEFNYTDYEDDPEAFKTEMVLTAYALKELGL